ncbi:MAG: stress responsive protein [Zetaproteobacteria bacterium]|nr:MAG: stress responsive protein [Zetaproteobacteria bacterium]
MIRHIVMFSAKQPENIDTIYQGLKMLETIDGDWILRVTKNAKVDQIANDIDVVVYGEFPDEDALAVYKSHPTYIECISVVRPLRDKRIAVDIPA